MLSRRTTRDARPTRSGVPVRVRITAAVALLVGLALTGAGLLVFVIETQRVDSATIAETEQELDEFSKFARDGIDPRTGESFDSVRRLLLTFIGRNVPDDDEIFIAWNADGDPADWPRYLAGANFPSATEFAESAQLAEAAERIVADGESTRVTTADGEMFLTAQPVRLGGEEAAIIVACFVGEDQAELQDTMRTYAIVASMSLLLIVLVALWQSGRLLAPLRTLRETADSIGETDLGRRLPEVGNDDITALTRTFNHMLERLELAFIGQRQLVDDAGHELKTPLTVLRGHLELLDVSDPQEVAETKTMLLDEIDRMSRLVTDLILLAKSNQPDFLDLERVDLGHLTGAVIAKARVLGRREWLHDGRAEVVVDADQHRLTQAMLQLADNAVKHTAEGAEIGIGSSVEADRALLWVRDTGAGVPAADRERIFERFGRSVVPDHDEGFGLGLSIVRAIAAGHGGTVHVEDAVPHGARFVIMLPRDRSGPDVPPPDQPTATRAPTTGTGTTADDPTAGTTDDDPTDDTRPLALSRSRREARQAWPAS